METELLLPGVLGTRMLGLMEQRGSVWNSALRLKYGLGGEHTDFCGKEKSILNILSFSSDTYFQLLRDVFLVNAVNYCIVLFREVSISYDCCYVTHPRDGGILPYCS